MQQIPQSPPWPDPAGYCQDVNGWTITQVVHSAAYNQECGGLVKPPACFALPLSQTGTSTFTVWSSDTVFCLDRYWW